MLKAKPGQYNYATAGVGSGAHVSIEKFNVAPGVERGARAAQGHAADPYRDPWPAASSTPWCPTVSGMGAGAQTAR